MTKLASRILCVVAIGGCASETNPQDTAGSAASASGGVSSTEAGVAAGGAHGGTMGKSGAGGATPASTGGNTASADSGAGGSMCWTPTAGDALAPGPGKPSEFDGSTFGCYPPNKVVRDLTWIKYSKAGMPVCPGARCGEPRELPCGACTESADYACRATILAACDCGEGPFLDQYVDSWICRCENGQWDCRLFGPSGSSCEVCRSHLDAGSG